jgi:hypothetical protein
MPTLTNVKFGRSKRTFNPAVPHFSALMAGRTATLPPPPPSVNYTTGMPADLGMMLNDNLGDCTCAAYYHARQVWTINAQSKIVTEPDSDVEKLYIQACGYNPKKSGEGPGGNEQAVLTYLLKKGAPVGAKGTQRHKIAAFIEVDPRNTDDVKRTIDDCGVAYIGFPIYTNFKSSDAVWDYDPSARLTKQGHAVVLAGYDAAGAILISWGQLYRATWAFVNNVVDETYAIADRTWVRSTGKTPGGLSLADLEKQMDSL